MRDTSTKVVCMMRAGDTRQMLVNLNGTSSGVVLPKVTQREDNLNLLCPAVCTGKDYEPWHN